MLIFKSFLKSKITRIYLICLTFLLIGVSVLKISEHYYILRNNRTYINPYIEVKTGKSMEEKIKKLKGVDKVNIGVSGADKNSSVYITYDENLKKNEVIAPAWMQENEEKVSLTINGEEYIFDEVKYEGEELYAYAINKELYDDLLEESDEATFRITLKDWSERDEFTEVLDKKIGGLISGGLSKAGPDYTFLIKALKKINVGALLILIVVLIASIVNLIKDEELNNKIYYYLGYKKSQLKILNIEKIGLILTIAIGLALLVSVIFIVYMKTKYNL